MKPRVVFVFAILLPFPASADVTATYVNVEDATVTTIEVASNGDMRSAESGSGHYYITQGGHGYIVKSGPTGPTVMRTEDVATVIAEASPPSLENKLPMARFMERGSLIVNGRTGAAFFLNTADGKKPTEAFVVVGKDPNLLPLGEAMARVFEYSVTLGMPSSNHYKLLLDIVRTGAPLKFMNDSLSTVDLKPIPKSRFDLPAKPETLDSVRNLILRR